MSGTLSLPGRESKGADRTLGNRMIRAVAVREGAPHPDSGQGGRPGGRAVELRPDRSVQTVKAGWSSTGNGLGRGPGAASTSDGSLSRCLQASGGKQSDPSLQVPVSRPSWDKGLSQPDCVRPGLVTRDKPRAASLPPSPPGVSSSLLDQSQPRWPAPGGPSLPCGLIF